MDQNPLPPPPHQLTRDRGEDRAKQGLEDLGGWFPDAESAFGYHSEDKSAYHRDRLRAMKILVEQLRTSKTSPLRVVDFGIGDGKELVELGLPITSIVGIDISPHMISRARENLAKFEAELVIGGVEALSDIEAQSADLVVATNVLGYLSPIDEARFLSEAARILQSGGWALFMLGNELFDLFALNSGTVSFFEEHLNVGGTEQLLSEGSSDRFGTASRHNPLSLEAELHEYGFRKVTYSFSQWHEKPPILEELGNNKSIGEARLSSRNHGFDANRLPVSEKWKALFQCSMFGALFQKL